MDLRNRIRRGPHLGDQVHDALREGILTGKFRPGLKMTEREVSESLGVSRTPVREALFRLAQEGLVEPLNQVGFRVLPISVSDVMESYVCRAALEGLAVDLAAERSTIEEFSEVNQIVSEAEEHMRRHKLRGVLELNSKFHSMLVRLARNRRLMSLYEVVNTPIDRYRRLLLTLVSGSERATQEYMKYLSQSMEAHRRIAVTLTKGRREEAARLMREHVLATGRDLAAGLRMADREHIVASGIILDANQAGEAFAAEDDAPRQPLAARRAK